MMMTDDAAVAAGNADNHNNNPNNIMETTDTTNSTTEEGASKKVEDTKIPLLSATELLFANESEKKLYWDRSHYDSPESQMRALALSKTVYVGNLAFSTRSHHLRAHFSLAGPVHQIHLGLDRFQKTPCGFCFMEFQHRAGALQAVAHLSETKLDGRIIRVELDAGFQPGRQYGRGVSGGQVRDDRRNAHDPARQHQQQQQRHKPKWTPPPPKHGSGGGGSAAAGTDGHYGPESSEKRDREDEDDQEMESNKRYREE